MGGWVGRREIFFVMGGWVGGWVGYLTAVGASEKVG